MKKIVILLILVGIFASVFLFFREKLSFQKPDEENKTEYFYAMYESAPVKYEKDAFVGYEEIEKSLKAYGVADLDEGVFSLLYKKKYYEFTLGEEWLEEAGKKIAKYRRNADEIEVDVRAFLDYFQIPVTDEKDMTKEQIESVEHTEAKSDVALGLFSMRNANYLCVWDPNGNDSKQKFNSKLDVVIPKWLELKSGAGTFNTFFDREYYRNVKSQNKDIWVLVTNAFDPDLTSEALNSHSARKNMVDFLVNYAVEHEIDGINIDFENMHLRDSDEFVQFVAMLNHRLFEHNKILSVCVTVPGGSENWSLVYDRNRLAQNCDYLTLMAYDQHWASSQKAGPVAAYSWVEKHLDDMLLTIPANKIILGVPYYTRVWYESFSTEVPNKIKVRSRSVYMQTPVNMLKSAKNVTKVWDEDARQYFYAYFDVEKNEMVKFWYDDVKSISEKASLSKAKGLSGVAAWALGFEEDEIWQAVYDVMK